MVINLRDKKNVRKKNHRDKNVNANYCIWSTGLSQVWWLSPWSDIESLQNHSKY